MARSIGTPKGLSGRIRRFDDLEIPPTMPSSRRAGSSQVDQFGIHGLEVSSLTGAGRPACPCFVRVP